MFMLSLAAQVKGAVAVMVGGPALYLLGNAGLAIVDRNSLAGIVRAHEAAKTTGSAVVGLVVDALILTTPW